MSDHEPSDAVALARIVPPCWPEATVTLPDVASIVVPDAGLTVPGSSEYCTPAALAGCAFAVMVTPDSSGIVAFCGEIVTLVTEPPAAGCASSRWMSPEAIARQTARLPAVRWSESTCSTPSGAPPTASGAATTG